MSDFITSINATIRVVKDMADESGKPIDLEEYVKTAIEKTVTKEYLENLDIAETKSTPEYKMIDGADVLFANGTPIVIEAPEGNAKGCIAKWDGGEQALTASATVFGGRHDSDIVTNTSITVNGGTLQSIFGGGLHKSHVKNSVVVINGGNIRVVMGGGANYFVRNCDCSQGSVRYEGDAKESPCRVDNADVTVNGGDIFLLYGGPESYGYTGKTKLTINNTPTISYLTPGGSNGYTGFAELNLSGIPKINILQGVNRGTIDESIVNINGGNIAKYFVGGETPFSGSSTSPNGNDASGKLEKTTVNVGYGVSIKEASYGGYDYNAINKDTPVLAKYKVTGIDITLPEA